MVGVLPSCALLGGFAIGAQVSLLWQHSANAKCQWVLVHLPTSPVYSSHFTLWNPKSHFQEYYPCILQIIYFISEENKLLLSYPPHLKNVIILPCKMHNFFIWLKVMLSSTTLCWNSAHVANSQQDASKTPPYHGLVLNRPTHALVSLTVSKLGCTISSSSLSLEQKSTDSITETCCWRRNCYQQFAALLETCLSFIKTMRQHIVVVTESSFCAVRHPTSSVLVASQQSWPQPGRLPRLGHAARVLVSSMNPHYRRVAEAPCCNMGWISAWTMQLISGEKDWKHVSMQKVVTLNTCSDVACLTFQLPHITAGSSHSHQCLEERNITLYISQIKKILHFTR